MLIEIGVYKLKNVKKSVSRLLLHWISTFLLFFSLFYCCSFYANEPHIVSRFFSSTMQFLYNARRAKNNNQYFRVHKHHFIIHLLLPLFTLVSVRISFHYVAARYCSFGCLHVRTHAHTYTSNRIKVNPVCNLYYTLFLMLHPMHFVYEVSGEHFVYSSFIPPSNVFETLNER